MSAFEEAVKKLDEGYKAKTKNKYANVINSYVNSALTGFCKQSEQFAEAVINGGSYEDCLEYCVEGISQNSGISDIDVYRRAVQFYFPGAAVDFHISIVMADGEIVVEEEPKRKKEKAGKPDTNMTEDANNTAVPEPEKVPKEPPKQRKKKVREPADNVIQLDLF